MNSAWKKVLTLVILLTLATITPLIINTAKAFPGDKPAIIVEPSQIKDPSMGPGTTFQVEINLYNVTAETVPNGLYGVEVKLTWNPAILELMGIDFKIGEAGGVLNSPYFAAKNETGDGYYWVAVSSLPPAEVWFGDGTIIAAEFRVIGIGKTGINLQFTDIVDGTAVSLSHYKQSGIFENRAEIPTALVKIDPQSIIDSSLVECKNFSINIIISNVENLLQFSFQLNFNPEIIEAVETNWTETAPPPTIDNEAGTIQGSIELTKPISGEISIITIKFHVINIGESTLHLSNITLLDEWGDEQPFETSDGYFNNMLITRIFVYPEELIDTEAYPGKMVPFEIKVENAFNLYFCSFKLAYNNEIINYVGAIANVSLGLVTMEQIVDNGLLHINLTYYDTPTDIGPATTIITLYFQVAGYGSSVLDLHETQLINSEGEPITHQSEDGFFMTLVRDVAVIKIVSHPDKVYSGRIVYINVTVSNLGYAAESFEVSLYYDETNIIGTKPITDLEAGQNFTVTFEWNTTGLESCTTHILKANVTELPYEINLENNVLVGDQPVKIKLLGDVDGDGEVGLTDLVIISQAYGATPEDSRWNSDADLDGDNKIGLADLVTCGFLYGNKC